MSAEGVRPAPLVGPEVDLKDFAFLPLDVVRLRDSGLTAKASGEEFRAAVLLWCASWHQQPAASLPNDDEELANLCGYARAMREWMKVRKGALRGWVECSDGRLYHPTVAEKARDAWQSKLAQRARTESARKAREEARQRQLQALSQTPGKSVTEVVTESKGQGQGQGQGLKEIGAPQAARRASRLPPDWAPSPDDIAFAGSVGLANGKAEAEAAKFRDFWTAKSGKDATKLDWSATWRNWVRRAADEAPRQASHSASTEPEWRREQRERNEAFLGPAAAKRRTTTVDMEATDAAPRLVG